MPYFEMELTLPLSTLDALIVSDMQSFAETVQSFAVVEKDSGNRASKIE
jgi:hypothetical protein